MHEATESIASLDRGADDRRAAGGGRSWWASGERPVRALAVVVIDVDAQDAVELARMCLTRAGRRLPITSFSRETKTT
jgi:hypothetical protein